MQLCDLVITALFCACAALFDSRQGRVPNALNGCGVAAGLSLGALHHGWRGLAASAAGALVGMSLLLLPFLLKMVGGGDVKFLAAAGSLLGCKPLCCAFLAGAFLGGAVGLVGLSRREGALAEMKCHLVLLMSGIWRIPDALKVECPKGRRRGGEAAIPYVVPLALGVVLAASLSVKP